MKPKHESGDILLRYAYSDLYYSVVLILDLGMLRYEDYSCEVISFSNSKITSGFEEYDKYEPKPMNNFITLIG